MSLTKKDAARVEAQKQRIIAYLADGAMHTYTEIQKACGLTDTECYNRLATLRSQGAVEYMGRWKVDGYTFSHYRRATQPGEIPANVAGMPDVWLKWGGWAA